MSMSPPNESSDAINKSHFSDTTLNTSNESISVGRAGLNADAAEFFSEGGEFPTQREQIDGSYAISRSSPEKSPAGSVSLFGSSLQGGIGGSATSWSTAGDHSGYVIEGPEDHRNGNFLAMNDPISFSTVNQQWSSLQICCPESGFSSLPVSDIGPTSGSPLRRQHFSPRQQQYQPFQHLQPYERRQSLHSSPQTGSADRLHQSSFVDTPPRPCSFYPLVQEEPTSSVSSFRGYRKPGTGPAPYSPSNRKALGYYGGGGGGGGGGSSGRDGGVMWPDSPAHRGGVGRGGGGGGGGGSGHGRSPIVNRRFMEPVDGFIYQVQFKRAHKNFILAPSAPRNIIPGDFVKVEADRGEDMGVILAKHSATEFEEAIPTAGYRGRGFCSGQGERKFLFRLATLEERAALSQKVQDEERALEVMRSKVMDQMLPMTILDAEYQFDRHKLTFFFEADRRIDFRELVSELFSMYKTRIWMQQVDTTVVCDNDPGTELAKAMGFLPDRDDQAYLVTSHQVRLESNVTAYVPTSALLAANGSSAGAIPGPGGTGSSAGGPFTLDAGGYTNVHSGNGDSVWGMVGPMVPSAPIGLAGSMSMTSHGVSDTNFLTGSDNVAYGSSSSAGVLSAGSIGNLSLGHDTHSLLSFPFVSASNVAGDRTGDVGCVGPSPAGLAPLLPPPLNANTATAAAGGRLPVSDPHTWFSSSDDVARAGSSTGSSGGGVSGGEGTRSSASEDCTSSFMLSLEHAAEARQQHQQSYLPSAAVGASAMTPSLAFDDFYLREFGNTTSTSSTTGFARCESGGGDGGGTEHTSNSSDNHMANRIISGKTSKNDDDKSTREEDRPSVSLDPATWSLK